MEKGNSLKGKKAKISTLHLSLFFIERVSIVNFWGIFKNLKKTMKWGIPHILYTNNSFCILPSVIRIKLRTIFQPKQKKQQVLFTKNLSECQSAIVTLEAVF